MNRKILVALVTLVCGTAFAWMSVAIVSRLDSGAQAAAPSVAQSNPSATLGPDTSSPDWKRLSEDVGIMLRRDDRLGVRGRIYVRVNGEWQPVATDGPADIRGVIPVK